MERLFAMLLAVLLSIFNNVPYTSSGKPAYNEEGVYMFADEDGYTTQELNQKNTGVNTDLDTAPQVSDAVKQGGLYSPMSGKTLTEDQLNSTKLTWDGTNTIVMPETATVQDDSNLGNGGHDLTLKSGDYTFKFVSMTCRYCDMNKPVEKTWSNTKDLTGKTINAGCAVGVARQGTTLEIYRGGKAIKLSEYFN